MMGNMQRPLKLSILSMSILAHLSVCSSRVEYLHQFQCAGSSTCYLVLYAHTSLVVVTAHTTIGSASHSLCCFSGARAAISQREVPHTQ